MAAPDFPSKLDQITSEWLTRALRASGALTGGEVVGHEFRPIGEPGQTADLTRIALRYVGSRAGAPDSLVAKVAASHEPARQLARNFGLYEREVRFYQTAGLDSGLPVPRCYFAAVDPERDLFVLLLEDKSDVPIGDWLDDPPERVERVARHLPGFHAKWWESPELDSFDWALDLATDRWLDVAVESLERTAPVVLDKFQDLVTPVFADCAAAFLERPHALREMGRSPRTLIHGDLHSKQIFFEGDDGVSVFDWQVAGLASGVFDLSRVVLIGLDPGERRAREPRLIREYHEALQKHGITDYPLERLIEDYRLSIVYSLWIFFVAFADTDLEILRSYAEARGASMEEVLFERMSAVLEDHDVLGLLRAL